MSGRTEEETERVEALRRVGLTRSEARCLASVERLEAETASRREAGFVGVALWGLWKGLHHGFRPAWFILSVLAAVYCLVLAVQARGVDAVLEREAGPSFETRLDQAFRALVPAGEAAEDVLLARMDAALIRTPGGAADIDLFHAWAVSAPRLIGDRRLSLEGLAGEDRPQTARRVEAELVAMPAWRRQARLDEGRQARLDAFAAVSEAYPGLYFAPEEMMRRYRREARWHDAVSAASEDFLRGRTDGVLDLARAPGLAIEAGRMVDDDRAFVAGLCLASGRACSEAMRAALHDGTDFRLAAFGAGEGGHPGARLLRAAWIAGRPQPGWAARMEALLADPAPLAAAGAEALPDTSAAFAAPAVWRSVIGRTVRPWRDAPSHIDIRIALDDLLAVSDRVGPLAAIRLTAALDGPRDLGRLRRIVEAEGLASLVLLQAYGPDMLDFADAPGEAAPARITHFLYGAAAAGFSALAALMAALRDVARRPLLRRARRMRWWDARLSRLFLGRKA